MAQFCLSQNLIRYTNSRDLLAFMNWTRLYKSLHQKRLIGLFDICILDTQTTLVFNSHNAVVCLLGQKFISSLSLFNRLILEFKSLEGAVGSGSVTWSQDVTSSPCRWLLDGHWISHHPLSSFNPTIHTPTPSTSPSHHTPTSKLSHARHRTVPLGPPQSGMSPSRMFSARSRLQRRRSLSRTRPERGDDPFFTWRRDVGTWVYFFFSPFGFPILWFFETRDNSFSLCRYWLTHSRQKKKKN